MKDGIWGCRFTLATIYSGTWDLPFYLAIGDKFSETYRIAHRIGGLFVVCGCSILDPGICGGFILVYGDWVLHCVARHYDLTDASRGTLLPSEAVDDDITIRPGP